MTFDEIMQFHPDNPTVFKEIKDRIAQLVPFVGAGLSVIEPGGSDPFYPLWEKSLRMIGDKLTSPANRETLKAILNDKTNGNRLMDAAQFLEEKRTPANLAMDFAALFTPNKLDGKDGKLQQLPVWLLPMLFPGMAVTTNLDRVLETVYQKHNIDLPALLPGERPGVMRRRLRELGSRFLLKLHGTVEEDGTIDYGSVVFTAKQYEAHYSEDATLVQDLRSTYQSKILLFLGCSLDQDKTLDILQGELTDGFYNYAITNCTEDDLDDRTAELGRLHIRAILYPDGEYDSVRILLAELLRLAPTKLDLNSFV